MEQSVSFLLSADLANKAIDMVMPSILAMMESKQFKRPELHIVVMNPGKHPWNTDDPSNAILVERTIGNPDGWEKPYGQIARAKAITSWRTGLPTRDVVQTMPYLLTANEDWSDSVYPGSAVLFGIAVGASGVQSWYDEFVSYMVAAACRALCIELMQTKYIPEGERDRCFIWQRDIDGNSGSR